MEMKRKILDEYQTRAWFEAFGEELGFSFDDVFGNMDINPETPNFALKEVKGILFIKMKSQKTDIERYIGIPQLDMFH